MKARARVDRGHYRVSHKYRKAHKKHKLPSLPPGVSHDPETDHWYLHRHSTRPGQPAQPYDPNDASKWYDMPPAHLRLHGKTLGPGGYVVAMPEAREAQDMGGGLMRYVPEPRTKPGVIGEHAVVEVKSKFEDTEEQRELDAVEAMEGVATFVKGVLGKHPSWQRVGLTFIFLLSGEQSDGTLAEERTDNGLYRVATSVIVYPRGDNLPRLKQAAAGVMDRINEGFGGGIEQRFYGVSQWRLLSVDVSVSPMRVGKGGPTREALLATGHPLFLRAQPPPLQPRGGRRLL